MATILRNGYNDSRFIRKILMTNTVYTLSKFFAIYKMFYYPKIAPNFCHTCQFGGGLNKVVVSKETNLELKFRGDSLVVDFSYSKDFGHLHRVITNGSFLFYVFKLFLFVTN